MNTLILFSILFLSQPLHEKVYTREESICSFSYNTTRQWELKLKEDGTFILTTKKRDTRFDKTTIFNSFGTWENRNDTIVLTAAAPGTNDCYFNVVKYIVSAQGSISLYRPEYFSICLPGTMASGNRFTIKL